MEKWFPSRAARTCVASSLLLAMEEASCQVYSWLSLSLSLSLSSVLLMCCQVVLLLCVANVFLAGILLALSISFMCC